jgi:hypothetical protein
VAIYSVAILVAMLLVIWAIVAIGNAMQQRRTLVPGAG